MLDHGITEKIIRPNANPVMTSTHFWVRVSLLSVSTTVSAGSVPRPVGTSGSSSGSSKPTRDAAGSRRIFAA